MAIQHKKAIGIYHWDTFDNTTILVGDVDTLYEADKLVAEKYKDRVDSRGADQVEVVDRHGIILRTMKVR